MAVRVTTRSEALFERAQELMPGGVNSPVRAFRGVGGTPRFIARGAGAWLEDADGHRYVDLVPVELVGDLRLGGGALERLPIVTEDIRVRN